MTHEELCERARRWLSGTRRCEPVFSRVASCREIPDAIGWSSCWNWRGSTVVECKTSRADFMADRQKYILWRHPDDTRPQAYFDFRRFSGRPEGKRAEAMGYRAEELPRMGDFRLFMCEPGVITAEMLEKHAPDHGLIYVPDGRRVQTIRPAPRRELAMIDKDAEIRFLRFTIINGKQRYECPEIESCQTIEAAGDTCEVRG